MGMHMKIIHKCKPWDLNAVYSLEHNVTDVNKTKYKKQLDVTEIAISNNTVIDK